MPVRDLYTAKDVKETRANLLLEQYNRDVLTGLEIPENKAVLDHAHDDNCFVRGVLHRNVNSALGRLENTWLRDLSWWYPYDLPTFLEQAACYLRIQPDSRYRHPNWLAKLKVSFNKLSSSQQDKALVALGATKGKNLKERKEIFSKIVLDRSKGFEVISLVLKQAKES